MTKTRAFQWAQATVGAAILAVAVAVLTAGCAEGSTAETAGAGQPFAPTAAPVSTEPPFDPCGTSGIRDALWLFEMDMLERVDEPGVKIAAAPPPAYSRFAVDEERGCVMDVDVVFKQANYPDIERRTVFAVCYDDDGGWAYGADPDPASTRGLYEDCRLILDG